MVAAAAAVAARSVVRAVRAAWVHLGKALTVEAPALPRVQAAAAVRAAQVKPVQLAVLAVWVWPQAFLDSRWSMLLVAQVEAAPQPLWV